MATLAGSSGSGGQHRQAGPSSGAEPRASGKLRDDKMGSTFFGNTEDAGSDEDQYHFTLVWGGEKFRIPLPPPDAPLSALRAAIEERTGVAPQHQKLVVGGAIMQKDLPLKTYGLVRPSLRDDYNQDDDGSRPSLGIRDMLAKWGLGNSTVANKKNKELKITMIASKDASAIVRDRGEEGSSPSASEVGAGRQAGQPGNAGAPSQSQTQAQTSRRPPAQTLDEPRVVAQIDSLVTNTLDRLKPQIDTVLKPEPAQTLKEINQQYLVASEMLLQTLMKLDGFQIESQWNDARRARKEGIRRVQGLLDQIDAAKDSRQSTL